MCVLSRVSYFLCICWWWNVIRKIWAPSFQHCEGTSRCWFRHRQSRASSGLCWCQHLKASWWLLWIHTTCPHRFIIEDVGLSYAKAITKPILATVQKPLHSKDSPSFNGSVVSKLNYIVWTTWPDIIYAAHKCAHFSADPHQEHGETMVYLARNLLETLHYGLSLLPTKLKVLNAMLMQIFVETGINDLHLLLLALPS